MDIGANSVDATAQPSQKFQLAQGRANETSPLPLVRNELKCAMKVARSGFAFLFFLVVACAIGWTSTQQSEPRLNGKPLSFWLNSYYSTSSPQCKDEAANAIRKIGGNGIPVLLSFLEAEDSELNRTFHNLASKQHIFAIRYISDSDKHVLGDCGFQVLGSSASNAVPRLTAIYELYLAVQSKPSPTRALASIGPAASSAIPALLRGITNSDERVRVSAIWVLGCIHEQPDLVIPVLAKLLGDSSISIRRGAANSLGKFGHQAMSAAPALVAATQDSDVNVRELAARALEDIDPDELGGKTNSMRDAREK